MKTWIKMLLVTMAFGIPAFLAGPVLWPPAEGMMSPTAGQLPFFVVLAAIEAFVFGLGVAFVIFGLPLTRTIAKGSPSLTWAMFLSVAWLLLSWWPHDNLHIHNGSDMHGLLLIEYGFHVTLMVSGLALAYCFMQLLRSSASAIMDTSAEHESGIETQARA
jgi:hypothetical protein